MKSWKASARDVWLVWVFPWRIHLEDWWMMLQFIPQTNKKSPFIASIKYQTIFKLSKLERDPCLCDAESFFPKGSTIMFLKRNNWFGMAWSEDSLPSSQISSRNWHTHTCNKKFDFVLRLFKEGLVFLEVCGDEITFFKEYATTLHATGGASPTPQSHGKQ